MNDWSKLNDVDIRNTVAQQVNPYVYSAGAKATNNVNYQPREKGKTLLEQMAIPLSIASKFI